MLVLEVCECVAAHAGQLGPVSPELDEQQGQLLRLQDSGETGEKALQDLTTRAAPRRLRNLANRCECRRTLTDRF